MPKIVALGACIILCIEIAIMFFDITPQKITHCTDPEQTYYTSNISENGVQYQRFHNLVDGYNLLIEDGWTADMSQCDIVTVLTKDNSRIEIYRQPTATETEQEEYVGYSNGFAKNTTDHKVSAMEILPYGLNYAMTTIWEREKSTVIEKDYNHYATFDITTKGNTYSIFIKSEDDINPELYETMVKSFQTESIKKSFTSPKTAAVNIENRGWNEETEAFYRKYFVDSNELTWGLFEPDLDYFSLDNYRKVEEQVNYVFPIMLWYNNITKEPDIAYWESELYETYERGKVLELTLQTVPVAEGEQNMVYGILQGKYDDYLKNYAETISKFDHPVLFRLANEMNGDWCAYSGYQTGKDPLIYVEFYRYVYQIFEEAGANKNVIWVWNPNGKSMPPFQWNHMMMYYPGDEYVDIVGLTAYNTGTYYAEVGETWQTFKELYQDLYTEYNARFGQPLMITEFASASEGGDKAQWIRDMFRDIKDYPNIKVAVWWNSCDLDPSKEERTVARSYFINETDEIIDIFRENLNQ